MIAKSAVEKFLNRELEDWDWLKQVPEEDLKEKVLELWPTVKFKTYQPMHHQWVSLLIGMMTDGYCFYLDMGTGKTYISLNIFRYLRYSQQADTLLVVVPNEVAVESWMAEIKQFTNFKAIALIGSKESRMLALSQETDIYLINYGGLQVMMSEMQAVTKKPKATYRNGKRIPAKGKAKTSNKRVIDDKKATEFAQKFDMVVFDEIHHCKNSKSLQFQLSEVLSREASFRYGLTGTPFGRNPTDLWAEMYLTDRGETLGETLEMFQAGFFRKVINYAGYQEWEFDKRKKFKLHKMIKHRSIRYADYECNDLPGSTKIPVPLKMTEDTKKYYERLLAEYRAVRTGDALAKENNYIKMRQIASGFVYLKDEESGEVLDILMPSNPKLDMLWELLEDIPEEKKVIIFHEFNKSCDIIEELLKQKKIKYVTLNGRTKDPIANLKKFQDPKSGVRVFVINSKSGASNLNLQIAKYMIFFETPVSPIVRKQAEKRSDRTGQTEKVFIYDLFIKGSIEEKIYEYLKEGKDLFDDLMTGEFRFG